MFNSSRANFWINAIPLLSSLFITLFVAISSKFLPPKLPLFYSLAWGDNQLANHQQLLIIPALISLIALLNLIISWQLHDSQRFFKRILIFLSLLISLILTITFFKIILIFI